MQKYAYLIHDGNQTLKRVETESFKEALEKFEVFFKRNLTVKYSFAQCAVVQDRDYVYGITWMPI